jgi:hypothetical protein
MSAAATVTTADIFRSATGAPYACNVDLAEWYADDPELHTAALAALSTTGKFNESYGGIYLVPAGEGAA